MSAKTSTTIVGIVEQGVVRLNTSQALTPAAKKGESHKKYEDSFPSLSPNNKEKKNIVSLPRIDEDANEKSMHQAHQEIAEKNKAKSTVAEVPLSAPLKVEAQEFAPKSAPVAVSALVKNTMVDDGDDDNNNMAPGYEEITLAAVQCAAKEGIDISTLTEKQQRSADPCLSLRWYAPSCQFPRGHFRITTWTSDGAVRNGLERFYTADGVLYHSINWIFGHRAGCESFFDFQTGQLRRVVPWIRGPLCKQRGKRFRRRASRKHGVEQVFDGSYLYTTMTWSNGKRHGPQSTVYVRTGIVLSERVWHNGFAHGEIVTRWRNGDVKSREFYSVGQKHGQQEFYVRQRSPFTSKDAKPIVKLGHCVTFVNGSRHGKETFLDGTCRYWNLGVQQEDNGHHREH